MITMLIASIIIMYVGYKKDIGWIPWVGVILFIVMLMLCSFRYSAIVLDKIFYFLKHF